MNTKAKATGARGSWFADVEGKSLPCVHQHWVKPGMTYLDLGAVLGDRKWDEYIAAIRKGGLVILTSDKREDDVQPFQRTGYIAVFEVSDVEAGQHGLSFRFTKRMRELI